MGYQIRPFAQPRYEKTDKSTYNDKKCTFSDLEFRLASFFDRTNRDVKEYLNYKSIDYLNPDREFFIKFKIIKFVQSLLIAKQREKHKGKNIQTNWHPFRERTVIDKEKL